MNNLEKKVLEFSENNNNIKLYVSISTTSLKEKIYKKSYTSYPKKISDNIYFFNCVFIDHQEANSFIKETKEEGF